MHPDKEPVWDVFVQGTIKMYLYQVIKPSLNIRHWGKYNVWLHFSGNNINAIPLRLPVTVERSEIQKINKKGKVLEEQSLHKVPKHYIYRNF